MTARTAKLIPERAAETSDCGLYLALGTREAAAAERVCVMNISQPRRATDP